MAVRRGPHVMLANTLAILFWSSTLLLVFTFAGYHLLISRLKGRPAASDGTYRTSVSVVVVAHNEADRIEARHELTAGGVRVVETSQDPYVAKLLQAHAEVVSAFIANGRSEMMKNHPLPSRQSQ